MIVIYESFEKKIDEEKEQANGKKRQVDQMNMNKMRTNEKLSFFFLQFRKNEHKNLYKFVQ